MIPTRFILSLVAMSNLAGATFAEERIVFLPERVELEPSRRIPGFPPRVTPPACAALRVVDENAKKRRVKLSDVHGQWGETTIDRELLERFRPFDSFEECVRAAADYEGRFTDEQLAMMREGRIAAGMPIEFAVLLLGPPKNPLERAERGEPGFFRTNEATELDVVVWGGLAMRTDETNRIARIDLNLERVDKWVVVRRDGKSLRVTLAEGERADRPPPEPPSPQAIERARRMESFGRGFAASRDGDFETAISTWRPLAEEGYLLAQYSLGDLYYRGEGVARDLDLALRWIRAAAEGGLHDAQYLLGYLHASGEGVERDLVAATGWFELAATAGNEAATTALATMRERLNAEELARASAMASSWTEACLERAASADESVSGPGALVAPGDIWESKPKPRYPELARVARVEAVVEFAVTVGADGTVTDLRATHVSRPNLGFEEAAAESIRQWRYEPALRCGRPTETELVITIEFRLYFDDD